MHCVPFPLLTGCTPTLPYYTLPSALTQVVPEYVKESCQGVDGSVAVERRQMTHLAPR